MLGLFFLLTLAWVLTLVYQKYARHYNAKDENFIGAKMALVIIIQLTVMIFVFRYLSEMAGSFRSAPTQLPNGPPTPKPWWKYVLPLSLIGLLSFVLLRSFAKEVASFVNSLLGTENDSWWGRYVITMAHIGFAFLILAKIFINNPAINNIYMFAIILFAAQFGYMMSRKGCITIFTAIAILDVFLVWMTSSGSTSDGGGALAARNRNWAGMSKCFAVTSCRRFHSRLAFSGAGV